MDTPEQVRRKESTGKLHIETPGDGCYLAYIRSIVTDLAAKIGFPEDEIAKIEMAVDEACSNVLEHAYARDKKWHWQHRDPEIRLDVRTEDGRLVIEINDHGQRVDLSDYRPANIDERIQQMKPGGYGIFIMRNFMDEVQYSSSEATGNTLR
jgi:anti-sigma regulatory factor (Ser/Thr protein kinase)